MSKMVIGIVCFLASLLLSQHLAKSQLGLIEPGAIRRGIVLHVVDGDTVDVVVAAWKGSPLEHTTIRIFGIDAPETLQQNAKCAGEITKGLAAKAAVQLLLPPGTRISFRYRGHDKYFRIDADVILPSGKDLAQQLLAQGLVQPYLGVGPKPNWC